MDTLFRSSDVQRLFQVGLNVARGFQSSVFLGSGRKLGRTSVLRQLYHRLRREQEKVIPFLYAAPPSSKAVEGFLSDYFQQIFFQFLDFQRRDRHGGRSIGFDASQMLPLAYETHFTWLVDFVRQYHLLLKNRDLTGLIKLAIRFPESAAVNSGLYAFVLVDDFHHLDQLTPPSDLALLKSELRLAMESRRAPFLLSGTSRPTFRRLYPLGELFSFLEPIFLKPLEFSEALRLFEGQCEEQDVAWDPLISSFIVDQLGKNPYYLYLVARATKFNVTGLRAPRRFAELYVQEIIQGSLHQYFSGLLQEVMGGPEEFVRAIELLEATSRMSGPCPIMQLREEQKTLCAVGVEPILTKLDDVGLIDFHNGIVTPLPDRVLYDWVSWNAEHRIRRRGLAQVNFDLVSELLRRCESFAENREKAELFDQIGETLRQMDRQMVPHSLFEFDATPADLTERSSRESPPSSTRAESMQLPHFLSVEIRSVRAPRGNLQSDQVLIARGNEGKKYDSSNEVAWIVGFFQNNESVGLNEMSRFHENAQLIEREDLLPKTRYWLITREKLNQAALSYAREFTIFTSSLPQLNLLFQQIRHLAMGSSKSSITTDVRESYELSIPVSAGSEMVAVRAFEQIAEGLEMEEKSRKQLRMALLEACIRFKESFLAQADRIFLTFVPQPDRLNIHLKAAVPSHQFQLRPDSFRTPVLKALLVDVQFLETPHGYELILSQSLTDPSRGSS